MKTLGFLTISFPVPESSKYLAFLHDFSKNSISTVLFRIDTIPASSQALDFQIEASHFRLSFIKPDDYTSLLGF